MKDDYRHKGLRKKLVAELRAKGIRDERILTAIGKVPRHFFLEKAFADWAYKDQAFPIGSDQTISQPYTVAYQTHLLEVQPGDRILEIGTGSGYQAVILYELKAKVYTIERQAVLFHRTNKLLKEMGYGAIRTYLKDGMQGLPRFAPFDKILVTAAAKEAPPELLKQLKIGGYLVIPVGGEDVQVMLKITRIDEDEFREEKFDYFKFVPLLEGVNDPSKRS